MNSDATMNYQFPTFDRQDLFNKAFLGLASQGFKRSVQQRYSDDPENVLCMYRDPEGRKCAVGWMIPDDYYSEDMEGKTASTLIRGLSINDLEWLTDLQNVHDHSRLDSPPMEERLRKFAADYGLTIPTAEPVAD